jgi:glycosyltransferase involved in cell wall biosynthesis
MTTALAISAYFSPKSEEMAHGVVQRLGTQIRALARVADQIDCLFLTDADLQCSAEEIRAHEEGLRRRWSAQVSLTIAPVARPKPISSRNYVSRRWQSYGPGIFDFHSQAHYSHLNNAAAVLAVRAALRAAPDLIFAHKLSTMSVLMKLSREIGRTPVFFDLDDIEHLVLARRLLRHPSGPLERLLLMHVPRLLLAERQAIRRSRLTFVCSEQDRRYLRRLGCSRHVEVVPNSVRFPANVSAGATEPVVLFVGVLKYGPNMQAADTLVRDIWPSVHARVPQARLVIAGNHPEQLRSYPTTDPSVTFPGFVDDLDELYRRARVVCCPIFYGGGTRVKIIEAAAHARAIVSTTLAAEGLTFENGREIVVRDDVRSLADECVRLLQDPGAAERLGIAAQQKARITYEQSAVVAQLERLFRGGLQPLRASRQANGATIQKT